MSNFHQERTLVLLDHYQRTAATALEWAQTVHDAAFKVTLSPDQQAVLVTGMIEAVNGTSQALASLRALLAIDPDIPSGPSMAAPIMRLS